MARTYFTKAQMIDFAKFIVSDERRMKKQKECKQKLEAGMLDPIPWTILVRQVDEQDFVEWKKKQEKL